MQWRQTKRQKSSCGSSSGSISSSSSSSFSSYPGLPCFLILSFASCFGNPLYFFPDHPEEGMRFFLYRGVEVILSMVIISSEKANAPTYHACAAADPAWLHALPFRWIGTLPLHRKQGRIKAALIASPLLWSWAQTKEELPRGRPWSRLSVARG